MNDRRPGTPAFNKYHMRINEDYLDTVSTDELTTSSRMEDGRPDSYDGVIMLIIPEATPILLKQIQKLISASPAITRVDELETRTDDTSIEIFAGDKKYNFGYSGSSYTFYHLAYGLKGNLSNIRAVVRIFVQLNKKFPGIIDAVSVFDTSDDSDHYNYDDEYFRLNTINALINYFSGNDALLKMRDHIANDFSSFVKSLCILCKRPTQDVLEVLIKLFNLTEVYLAADIRHNIQLIQYEIARESTDILRKHTPEHFAKFKKDVQNAEFFNHKDYNNIVQLYIHNLQDFLGENFYLSTKLDMYESAARDDIKYPQYAALGVRCPNDAWFNQWFEYVVPYTIDETGVIMLVIHTMKPEWMMEALEILYPDLSYAEKIYIRNQMYDLQTKQRG